jgi:hypothetical protein
MDEELQFYRNNKKRQKNPFRVCPVRNYLVFVLYAPPGRMNDEPLFFLYPTCFADERGFSVSPKKEDVLPRPFTLPMLMSPWYKEYVLQMKDNLKTE